MPRISFDVDEQLFKKFSLKVVKMEQKKKDVLVKLVREWVGEK